MGVNQGNQHLTVYVSNATAGSSLAAGAKLAAGQVTFMAASTGVGTATPPTVPFKVVYAYPDGKIVQSATIAAGTYSEITASAAVQKVQTLTVPGVAVAGALDYVVRLALPAYGGTISQQDEVFVYGNFKAKAGDTAAVIGKGLKESLFKAISKLPESVVVIDGVNLTTGISASTAAIKLTGVAQSYAMNMFEGAQQDFDVSLTGAVDVAPVLTTGPKPGVGVGSAVAGAEEFFAGYNSDYVNRQRNWPAVGNPQLVANPAKMYDSYSFVVENKFGGSMPVGQKQTILVYYKPQ